MVGFGDTNNHPALLRLFSLVTLFAHRRMTQAASAFRRAARGIGPAKGTRVGRSVKEDGVLEWTDPQADGGTRTHTSAPQARCSLQMSGVRNMGTIRYKEC